MTGDERPQSLADKAAAWVPPWQRADAPAPLAPPKTAPPVLAPPEPEPASSNLEPAPPEPEPASSDPEPVPPETTSPGLAPPDQEPAQPETAPPQATPASTVDESRERTDQPPPEPVSASTVDDTELVGTAPAEPEGPEAAHLPHDQVSFRESVPKAPSDDPSFPETDLITVPETGDAPAEAEQPGREAREDTRTPEVTAAAVRAEPLAEPSREMEPGELRGALEAILLVVDEPVSEAVLAEVLGQPAELVARVLGELAAEYSAARRGFELRRAAGGWRLYTRGEYSSYVERFVLDGQQVRLTQAALETLAVVAYKQPVTRSRISAIRGVNCDGVVRTLMSRGLIEECGTEPESGAHLYRTTTLFLEKLALDSVADLPPLAPFLPDDVDELTDAPPR